jgi:hypothetical protein
LRSTHETQLLQARRLVAEEAIKEAEEQITILNRQRDVVLAREQYYTSRLFMNLFEVVQFIYKRQARASEVSARASHQTAATRVAFNPDFTLTSSVGFPLAVSFSVGTTVGGNLKATWERLHAAGHEKSAASSESKAFDVGTLGEYFRRAEEWGFQGGQATKELATIDRQLEAANIRVAMARLELEQHELAISSARAVEAYLQSKFTNQELYSWMLGQISAAYFQGYQLAYDLAKRAERAFQHELGLADSDFIRFGYWDNLKKGLLAGEQLQYDLRRLETAYLEQNRREYELTKHVSLNLLDPIALLMLRETGQCFVSLPEAIFDLDHPGHYRRRIKSVTLTIPCVAGPYTSVSCTLTLLGNRLRVDSSATQPYAYSGLEDVRFRHNTGATQSIATSSGQNDGGLFELSFRDDRYLPFEGAGAISTWRLELPTEFRQFDYDTISDVVLHLRYTAREGGAALRAAAIDALRQGALNTLPLGQNGERSGLFRFFSARRDFSAEWHRFLHPAEGTPHTLQLDLTRGRLPYWMQALPLTVTAAQLYLKLPEGAAYPDDNPVTLDLSRAADPTPTLAARALTRATSPLPGLPHAHLEDWPSDGLAAWTLSSQPHPSLTPDHAEDLWLILELRLPEPLP